MKIKRKGWIFIGKFAGVVCYLFTGIYLGLLFSKYIISQNSAVSLAAKIEVSILAYLVAFLGLAIIIFLMYLIWDLIAMIFGLIVSSAKEAFKNDETTILPVKVPAGGTGESTSIEKLEIKIEPVPVILKNRYQLAKKS